MAGPFTGMDIAAVRGLSTQLTAKASDIRTLMQALTSQLDSTQWVGSDRERFAGDWQSQHCSALNSVIAGLEDAAARATRNADDQEAASNA